MNRVLLFALFFFMVSYSFAQSRMSERVGFGIKAGLNVSNMNFNRGKNLTPVTVESAWKTGFTVGAIVSVPLTHNLSFQPEYNYTRANGGDRSISTSYQLDYLSLPVLVSYRLVNRISVFAGPQFDLLIAARSESGLESRNITHDTEERSIGATGGIDLKIIDKLSINARYIHGVNNIGIGQRSAVKEFKFEQAQLTAVLKF